MIKNGYIYKLDQKHFTIFLKESILYPFVRFYDTPKGLLLKNEDFVDISMYAQSIGIITAFYKLKNSWKVELACSAVLFKNVPIFKLFSEIIWCSFPSKSYLKCFYYSLLQCIWAVFEYVFICSMNFAVFLRLQLTYYKV